MENVVYERFLAVKNFLNISEKEIEKESGISVSTIHKFRNGVYSSKTIAQICKHFKVSKEYLLNGTGEMFATENIVSIDWKDEAYRQLQQQNDFLQRMLDKLIGSPNFLNDIVCANAEMRRNIVSIAA